MRNGAKASGKTAQEWIEAMQSPPTVERLDPIAARFIHSLRLIALHERARRDPVPELATRLGNVASAVKALALAQTISASWPENIHVARFCCEFMTHDEATIGMLVDCATRCDRDGFELAINGLVRPDRHHRLWDGALALVAVEMTSR